MDETSNTPDAPSIITKREVKRLERFDSTYSMSPSDLNRKVPSTQPQEKMATTNEADLDDTITRATEGTSCSSFSLSSSQFTSNDTLQPTSSSSTSSQGESSSSMNTTQQQQFSSPSVDMRVSRSQARRAARRNTQRSTSPTASEGISSLSHVTQPRSQLSSVRRTTSLSPTVPPRVPLSSFISTTSDTVNVSARSQLTSSIRTEGGSIILTPDLEEEEEQDHYLRAGDDLVGRTTSIVSIARDSTTLAAVRSSNVSAMEQPPPGYRIDDPEKEEHRSSLAQDDELKPGAFSVPRRVFGGLPAWFEEALQRQQSPPEPPRPTTLRRASSARSSGNSSTRRLSLHSLRENSLQVFAKLYESSRANGSFEQGDDSQEIRPRRSGVARPVGLRRWSSAYLDASCMNLAVPNASLQSMDEEEESPPPSTSFHDRIPRKLSLAAKPIVKMVSTPIQLFRKKKKPQRSRSVDEF